MVLNLNFAYGSQFLGEKIDLQKRLLIIEIFSKSPFSFFWDTLNVISQNVTLRKLEPRVMYVFHPHLPNVTNPTNPNLLVTCTVVNIYSNLQGWAGGGQKSLSMRKTCPPFLGAFRSALQSVSVRWLTGNDVSAHYFHHLFLLPFLPFLRRTLFS